MAIVHHRVKPRSKRWFEIRLRNVTSSEVPAAAGLDLYGTPYSLWATKGALIDPPDDNDAMKYGRWVESGVAAGLREERPDLDFEYPLDLIVEDTDLRLSGTPDGRGVDEMGKSFVLEFKVISRHSYEEHWDDGVPPIGYQLQTLANAMLLGTHYGLLVALVHGYKDVELVVYRVERNPVAEARIQTIVKKFWAAFDSGHAPQPVYERDLAVLKAALRPRPGIEPLDLSSDNYLGEILDERALHKAAINTLTERIDAIDAEIIHKLDGAELATLPGWKITNKMQHRNPFTVPAKDYPVLRVARAKEKVA
jgi:predicted phage-related endonuclease